MSVIRNALARIFGSRETSNLDFDADVHTAAFMLPIIEKLLAKGEDGDTYRAAVNFWPMPSGLRWLSMMAIRATATLTVRFNWQATLRFPWAEKSSVTASRLTLILSRLTTFATICEQLSSARSSPGLRTTVAAILRRQLIHMTAKQPTARPRQ